MTSSEMAEPRPCWFVGAAFGGTDDQTSRFLEEGMWEGWGSDVDRHIESVSPGDRIAMKKTYTRKQGLPFDSRGNVVSVMQITATGKVRENLGDGCRLRVDWTVVEPPREWYFYTYRGTIWRVSPGQEWEADSLIEFTFQGQTQDIDQFRNEPYWQDRFGDATNGLESENIVEDNPTPSRQVLANDVYLPIGFLGEIETLLDDKLQVIFQGPPGTGKTYVAQKLAKHLAGSEDRVTLVQLHPSYAYEDFVQGFRPILLKNGQAGFELRDGPLLKAAKKAEKEPDARHFLVIDEINRGSLAKVFGELYFLLEYRDSEMTLQYSDEPFSLPSNLYIIGTMNTADRSIALVDLALRRRFYFVEFHPDDEPVKGVLRRWLEANAHDDMEWLADVVERVNELLEKDRHAAIGPSYFMKQGLNEAEVERIWKHSVLPYVEELRFGRGDAVTEEFGLDKLRGEVASEVRDEDEEQADGGADEGVASG